MGQKWISLSSVRSRERRLASIAAGPAAAAWRSCVRRTPATREAVQLDQFSVSARIRSFGHALRGIQVMLSTQHNAWIHAVATLAAIGAGIALRIGRGEWLAVVLAIMAVWTAEALNTAFESLCDVASPEFHPLVERAKDVAAGAVLISAIGAVAIALLVFGPRLLKLLG